MPRLLAFVSRNPEPIFPITTIKGAHPSLYESPFDLKDDIMTLTADLRPTSPLPAGMLSTPDLTKLYMSASCPELKAESVISSEFSDDENERFEPLAETPEEYGEEAFSMDCPDNVAAVEKETSSQDVAEDAPDRLIVASGPEPAKVRIACRPSQDRTPVCQACLQPAPEVARTVSSSSSDASSRRKLQWEFKGLTLWLELEEFDSDLTRACEDFSSRHSSPAIPKPHTTAIYGMEHLSFEEARARLRKVPSVLPKGKWPDFARPTGVTSDIAVCGRPGQVCSIAWSELTLASDPDHEEAMDALHRLFFGETWDANERDRPWKPHNSVAYDNPEDNALSLLDTVMYASRNPTLLGRGRRVEAMSLWSTVGKMEEWECVDRVRFW